MKLYVYATYTELFGRNSDETLTDILSRVHVNAASKILSILGYYIRESDEENVRKIFFMSFPRQNISKYRQYLKNHTLITKHGVLLAWKTILENKNVEQETDEKQLIKDIFMLILILQEKFMREKENCDINNFVMVNAAYNYYDCQANLCARAYYIFVKNKKNVEEIHTLFINKYGISIEDYIYLTTIVTSYINNAYKFIESSQKYFCNNWHFEINSFIGFIEEKKKELSKYLKMISFSSQDIDKESDKMLYFSKYPLLEIKPDYYFPLDRKLCHDLLFKSLLYKINDCYEKNDPSFWIKFGYLFQNYVDYICQEFCTRSNKKYLYIPEFSFGKSQKLSPDMMIVETIDERSYVLVIEVKASKLPFSFNDYINVSDEEIDKYVERLVINPLKQSMEAIHSVIKQNVKHELSKDAEYIFLAVTAENFPEKERGLRVISEEIQKYNNDYYIKDFNVMCIEEFELLLKILSFDQKKSFVNIFENYQLNKTDTLKNMLRSYPTQSQNRNPNLTCDEYFCNAFGNIYIDPVTNLNDECNKKAMDKYIYPNIRIPSDEFLFREIM